MLQYLSLIESIFKSKLTKTIYFTTEDIIRYLPNRSPSLLVEEAIFFNFMGTSWIGTRCFITEDKCDGHYPNFPIVRLADLIEFGGQSGALLLKKTYFEGKEIRLSFNPLAIRTDMIKYKNKNPVKANQHIFFFCQFGCIKRNLGRIKEIAFFNAQGELLLSSDHADYVFVELPLLSNVG